MKIKEWSGVREARGSRKVWGVIESRPYGMMYLANPHHITV